MGGFHLSKIARWANREVKANTLSLALAKSKLGPTPKMASKNLALFGVGLFERLIPKNQPKRGIPNTCERAWHLHFYIYHM